jgi:hypothetical protein
MEAIAPKSESQSAEVSNRSSAVAGLIPANTVAVAISHDYGRGLLETLETYRSDPSMAEIMDPIDQAIGFLGGPEAAVGWIGDMGITVTRTEDSLEGGLIVIPTDSAAAGRLFTSLRTVLSLGGSSMGISVRDEAYAGTTITIVDLGNVQDLAGLAGVPSDMFAGGSLPDDHIELAYAITDQVVILGSGPGFVRHVLDTTAESSLAAAERYKALVGRAVEGAGMAFVDVTALREWFEGVMAGSSAADVATYEQEVKPFLAPFDALVATTWVDGDLNRSTTIITVK